MESDFDSWRKNNPNKILQPGTDECIMCGLSVWDTLESIYQLRKRFRYSKDKMSIIISIRLRSASGLICQTTKNPNHYTWWPFDTYEIVENCKLVVE